jgi:hypothetical protein
MYLTTQTITRNGRAIIFNAAAKKVAIDGVEIKSADIQLNSEGIAAVPEGSFIAHVGGAAGSYDARFLPRTRLNAATATNSPTISLKTPCSQFKVGDVLYAKHSFARIKFIGTFATGDVITARIAGVTYSATVGATQTGAGAAADFATANAAALLTAGITFAQVGSTAVATIYANDSYDVYFATSGAAGQVVVETTEAGYLGDNLTPLGTILAIGAENATTGVRSVTLAANAAQALPINTIVGVNVVDVLGLYPDPVDLTNEPVRHFAVISEIAGIYQNNLPYIDLQLKRLFGLALHIKPYFSK